MALLGMEPSLMKSSALLLNVFVSFISFAHYYKEGHFKWKLFLPFAITSVPTAYLGAIVPLADNLYKKILAVCLLFAILRMVGVFGKEEEETKELKWTSGLIVGALIGFLSGMIGIGGGIILSPVILLFHWGKMKETAAVSALFILVNSISGLVALFSKGFIVNPEIYSWLAVAIVGGFAGAYMGSKRFDTVFLRYLLASVLLIASLKLFFT
jgi:uncharacterized membrane protein YfcA